MRILLLCSKPPFPAVDGGCLAMAEVIEGLLAAGDTVRVLCISTQKHPFNLDSWPAHLAQAARPISVEIDTAVKPVPALISLFSGGSYNLERFNQLDVHQALAELLQHEPFDVVQLEGLYMAHYVDTVRKHSKAKVVLRAHNVEHQIWKRMAANATNPLKKWYLDLSANRLAKAEALAVEQVDAVVPITTDDLKQLRKLGPIKDSFVLPMTLNFSQKTPSPLQFPLDVFHLGSMDWLPNLEAVDWFIHRIWPVLSKAIPELNVHLAGRKMPAKWMVQSNKNLHILAEVPNAQQFMLDHGILVLPLLSGGGMRVKLLEAMALGRVVVTTTIGMEGIPAHDGEHLFVANTPEEFVAAIEQLYRNPALAQQLADAGRALVLDQFARTAAMARLRYFYTTL